MTLLPDENEHPISLDNLTNDSTGPLLMLCTALCALPEKFLLKVLCLVFRHPATHGAGKFMQTQEPEVLNPNGHFRQTDLHCHIWLSCLTTSTLSLWIVHLCVQVVHTRVVCTNVTAQTLPSAHTSSFFRREVPHQLTMPFWSQSVVVVVCTIHHLLQFAHVEDPVCVGL
ncbi:uncharacterized protein LOC121380449 [Gigantopelta aegis]|uniref:uncharacterized protein LOC121380449 n=1 Tax=Gigantopelta aegis TaxID=1735272 RepID=UPI001B88C538|nr:uncharacterized protein LOC121380449 [Gigantopelta aegis]